MSSTRTLNAALAVAVSTAACSDSDIAGEPRECTQAGWIEGLVITAHAADRNPLPMGTYWFTINADGLDASVSALLDDNLIACAVNVVDCTREVPAGEDRVLLAAVDADATGFLIQLEYAGPAGSGGPAEVTIEIVRDQTPVGAADLTPHYERTYPNGPGCGLATSARAELVIDT